MSRSISLGIGLLAICLTVAAGVWWRSHEPSEFKKSTDTAITLSPTDEAVEASDEFQLKLKRERALALILDDEVEWFERVEAVRELPEYGVDETVLASLYAYLRREADQREEHWYVVANEVMELLRKQNLDPESYSDEMLRLIGKSSVPPVTRDYAIQHVTQWIAHPDADLPVEQEVGFRDRVFRELLVELEAGRNRELDLMGTGLTALAEALSHGEFEQPVELEQELADLVLKVASGEHATTSVNRLSAIQVAAEMGLPETAEICRGILAISVKDAKSPSPAGGINWSAPTDVQLSAVAALGLSGTGADISLLETVSTYNEALIYAARAAARRIENREPKS